ncbi:phosphomethylpyrimidine synthase ThiC [bacterium]|nr:phosphomethylpyrimidine synthase ThiC [bacterium]NIN92029.1 phosphomethylpyrimidine synthase ThiC [bacterium]NIO18245.1 phosphomethylpyrimidine synthase ThiC [bacterium]NIO73219.1 phosphomethylpyrimidine synthase ThiC [bacterium]
MTQLERAKNKKITTEMKRVAGDEGLTPEYIRSCIAEGTVVIPVNIKHHRRNKLRIIGIGKGLRTKVNANIGSSPDRVNIMEEKNKLDAAIKAGANSVMDLSTGGDIEKIRKMVLQRSVLPVGTVPIYQAACETARKGKKISEMSIDRIFGIIEQQAEQGVDFMTVHCGVTRRIIETLRKSKRITGIVSRGGAFLAQWIVYNNEENPLYEQFDRLLDVAYKYDVTLSLGDGLRPGSLADATDEVQIGELSVLGELAERAREKNVQVMIEGPGHVPLNQIEANVLLEKRLCKGAPFYVLGPLVTDVAPGYDHIVCAIGGAVAAASGADFLCYVTPTEHLRLPGVDDVTEGVIATRIAAHAADVAKGIKGASDWDMQISKARGSLNWKRQERFSINPEKFRQERKKSKPKDARVCTMCGEFCAMRQSDLLSKKTKF